jgi:preprotein translocase subunit YajC
MTDTNEPKPRPRWFQFDLRLLFVLIAAVGVILAFEMARRSRKAERKLLDTLAVGDSVHVIRGDAGKVTIYYGSSQVRGQQGTITEIGQDFVTIRVDAENAEALIPLSHISRVLRDLPATPPDRETAVSTKTLVKTTDPSTLSGQQSNRP